jgi:hypothetical protein
MVNSVHHLWTVGSASPRWTMDRASVVAHRSLVEQALRATAAHQRWRNGKRAAQGAHLGPHQDAGGGMETGAAMVKRRRW